MNSSSIRTALALALVAAIAAPAAASARDGGAETHDPKGSTPSVAYLEAGSTGTGPADDAECDRRADAINSWEDAANDAALDGDQAAVDKAEGYSNGLQDQALDRGCFILL